LILKGERPGFLFLRFCFLGNGRLPCSCSFLASKRNNQPAKCRLPDNGIQARFLKQPLAAVRDRPISETTLRVAFAWRWRAIGRHSRPGKKSYPHLLAVTGGGFGVSFWCEEESCSRVTVAAPFPVLIGYPRLAKKILYPYEFSVNSAREALRFPHPPPRKCRRR